MKKYLFVIVSGIFMLNIHLASAQQFEKGDRFWSIGAALYSANYFGDLAPSPSIFSTSISYTRPNFGLFVGKRITPRVQVRGGVFFGTLAGDDYSDTDLNDSNDLSRYSRNLHFRNQMVEVSGVLVYDFINIY